MKASTQIGPVLLAIAIAAAPAVPAHAATYSTTIEMPVATGIDRIWVYLGDFCTLVVQEGQISMCTSGNGGLGSIRRSPDGTEDRLVALGPYSYAFDRITGPLADARLHYALEVEAIDPLQSRVTVTLTWDEAAFPADERQGRRGIIRQIFESALQDAKVIAEAS
jgi:hypothetical protein